MKTKAVRLYGANDLRLDEFELPEIRDDEILARVVSDSNSSSLRSFAPYKRTAFVFIPHPYT